MIYPIIIYPNDFIDIVSKSPEPPKEPVRPREPKKPGEEAEQDLGFSWGEFIFLVIFIIGASLIGDKDSEVIGVILMAVGLPAAFVFLGRIFLIFGGKSDERYKENYPKLLAQYQSDISKYDKLYQEYKNALKDLLTPTSIELFRQRRFKEDFQLTYDFQINSEQLITKGVTENSFLKYLTGTFGQKILTNQKVLLDGYYYFPDFVFVDQTAKILIDIEIDEPYVGSTGEPIHYESKDSYRDQLFGGSGWIVVRFAEEQIVKNPKGCCECLSQIVQQFWKLKVIQAEEINLTKINTWDKDEAYRMAFLKYRHSYLPPQFHQLLKLETYETSRQISDSKISQWKTKGANPITSSSNDDDLPY